MGYAEGYYTGKIQCAVRRAADYLIERSIERVDFVKIDAEGMDLKVIKGFDGTIASVRLIQFEYWLRNIVSHDLLILWAGNFLQ